MPQLHTYIREAIDNLDDRKSQRDPLNRGHDPFDVFIDLIVKEIEEETEGKLRELRISEDFYKTKIERIIENVADAEDPIGEFHSQLDEVEEEIRDDHQEYRILFPLNFQHRRAPGFEPPIKIRDVEF